MGAFSHSQSWPSVYITSASRRCAFSRGECEGERVNGGLGVCISRVKDWDDLLHPRGKV